MDESNGKGQATLTWEDILFAARYMLNDVAREGLPAWTFGMREGRSVFIAYVATGSNVARRWSIGMRNERIVLDCVGEAQNGTGVGNGTNCSPGRVSVA